MADQQSRTVPETFVFTCGDCATTWEATFQVMFFTDPMDTTGLTTQEYVDADGKALATPLADAVCAVCGSRRVRIASPSGE
ncbi:hypothetical protein [Streptomyces sp. 4F14]|uniref:hypothetical protein n=1 Tax=Streptomyces sp. 4F14 TaxID=3394380 RepID=UPI003A85B645